MIGILVDVVVVEFVPGGCGSGLGVFCGESYVAYWGLGEFDVGACGVDGCDDGFVPGECGGELGVCCGESHVAY
ncbi:MAG: hypothetical protein O7C59_00615 [Rickettsia endosymbiont of Ixodes persulcatus]|nr:hypothetical protein [Rickettsia endosymbiont of Ixodes persulcatus]